MMRLAMFTVFNTAVLGSMSYAQYNLVDLDGVFQRAHQTTRAPGAIGRGLRGTRMGRSGSRSSHK